MTVWLMQTTDVEGQKNTQVCIEEMELELLKKMVFTLMVSESELHLFKQSCVRFILISLAGHIVHFTLVSENIKKLVWLSNWWKEKLTLWTGWLKSYYTSSYCFT